MRAQGWLGLVAFAGCTVAAGPPGNAELGVAEFRVTESAERTTVVALDRDDQPVGRLELVHGRFAPTEDFGEYNAVEVEGRKLNVEIRGQTFEWQTLGYSDTLHMPALPVNLSAVAAFVSDDHVRPLLQSWSIGWLVAPGSQSRAGDEVEYTSGTDYAGTDPVFCNGGGTPIACPILVETTTAACNGAAEYYGDVVRRDRETFGYYESSVSMCCSSDGVHGTYALKTCAAMPICPGMGPCHYVSSCGDSGTNKCQPCLTPPSFSSYCYLDVTWDGTSYNYFGAPIYVQHHYFE